LALLALLVSGSAAANTVYFNPANGHYYTLTSTVLDWQSAETEALGLGGHLAAVNDSAEQQFINETFLVGENATKALWIGLTDEVTEGVWQWTTGEPLTYTNWTAFGSQVAEPNNGLCNPCENYVAINWHYSFYGYDTFYFWDGFPGDATKGTWNDTPINGTPVPYLYQGIIEMPTIPVPGAVWLMGGALAALAGLRRSGN
jgi:hypothetical protein